MIKPRKPIFPEDIQQSAKHVLFVEGKEKDAFDKEVLTEFWGNRITIESLGPSYHVSSVAEALHEYHPYYYFLIDRDHHSDSFINDLWEKFPDPATKNLLVWHRREIENYFLIPDYLMKSQYLKVSEDELKQHIRKCCQKRIFLDTANQVIVSVRETLKKKWIKTFDKIDDFKTKEEAMDKIKALSEFTTQKNKVSETLNENNIIRLFDETLEQFTGGKDDIGYEKGRWIELIRGKEVLPEIVNHCFQVKDRNGKFLQGKEKLKEIAKDLIRLPLENQPDDFQKLHRIILDRINSN